MGGGKGQGQVSGLRPVQMELGTDWVTGLLGGLKC